MGRGKKAHLALKNRKARRAFKVYLHREEGVSASPALIDPPVRLKFAESLRAASSGG